jgi:hypothetical protein
MASGVRQPMQPRWMRSPRLSGTLIVTNRGLLEHTTANKHAGQRGAVSGFQTSTGRWLHRSSISVAHALAAVGETGCRRGGTRPVELCDNRVEAVGTHGWLGEHEALVRRLSAARHGRRDRSSRCSLSLRGMWRRGATREAQTHRASSCVLVAHRRAATTGLAASRCHE